LTVLKAPVEIATMRRGAEQATAVMRALANHDRLLLLCALSRGEASVGGLEEALQIHQPTLSQQLAALREKGLVKTRRDGKHIFYQVADARVLILLEQLYKLYCPKK
jgi:DNA-binding transcriptional ArsR family regulator